MRKEAFWESAVTVGFGLLIKLSAILFTTYASLWIYQVLSQMSSQGM